MAQKKQEHIQFDKMAELVKNNTVNKVIEKLFTNIKNNMTFLDIKNNIEKLKLKSDELILIITLFRVLADEQIINTLRILVKETKQKEKGSN